MKSEELLKVLEELEEESFQKFKWHLEDANIPDGHNGIPKSKLEKAEMQGIVDLMVQSYGTSEVVEVTKKVLEKIPRKDLVERLCESSSGAKEDSDTGSSSSQNQVSQPSTNQQTDGKGPAASECSGDTGSSSSQASQPPTPPALSPTSPLKTPDLNIHPTATNPLSDDSYQRLDTLRASGSPLSNTNQPSVASALRPTSPLNSPDLNIHPTATNPLSDDCYQRLDTLRVSGSPLSNTNQPSDASALRPTSPLNTPDLNIHPTATKPLSDDSYQRLDTLRSSGSPLSNISRPSVASGLSPTSLLKGTNLDFHHTVTKLLSDDPFLGLDTLSLSDSPFERLSGPSLTSAFDSRHSLLREPKLSFNHPGASVSNLLSAGLDHSHFGLDSLRLKQSGEQRLPSSVTTYTRELTVDQNQTGSNFYHKMSYHNSTETTTHHSSSSSSSLSDPFDRHFSSMLHRKF